MAEKRRRFKPEVRKAQIIEATKNLILENGLGWASSLRIAKALGISQAALYHHFTNKREILLETLTSVINETVFKITTVENRDDIEEYIREAARSFYDITITDPRQSRLMAEYLCAPPTENLREEVQGIFTGLLGISQGFVREGMAQGRFKDDLDMNMVAWIFTSLSIALNFGALLELPQFLTKEQALGAVDLILGALKK